MKKIMTQTFRIQFKGDLIEGYKKEDVIQTLALAYGKSQVEMEGWFNGRVITLKNEASKEKVEEFTAYFEAIGLKLVVAPIDEQTKMADNFAEKDPEADLLETLLSEPLQDDESLEKKLAASLEQIKSVIETSKHALILRPAKVWQRFLAYIIDLFIILIITSLAFQVLGFLGMVNLAEINQWLETMNQSNNLLEMLQSEDYVHFEQKFSAVMVPITLLYFIILEGMAGAKASYGKRIFKMRLYSLVAPNVMLRQVIAKVIFLKIISALVVLVVNDVFLGLGSFLYVASFLMLFVDKIRLNRTLYDHISKTCVGYR